MTKHLRVALIGQKFMGRAHSNAWGQVNRFFELPTTAVLDTVAARDGAELATFAKRWGWTRSTTDWRSIADDPAIDLVDVATSNDAHREMAIAMLESGKHVACEKPLAGTLDDARAMRDAARAAGRMKPGRIKAEHAKAENTQAGRNRERLDATGSNRGAGGARTFVWFNYRRCPAVALARELVRSGRIGRVHHVRATYLQSWGGADTPMSWRFSKKMAGSGAHGDLNAHIVDMARFVTGDEIVDVHGAVARTFVTERALTRQVDTERALTRQVDTERALTRPSKSARALASSRKKAKSDVDDAVLFLASFANGAVASFEASRVATGNLNQNTIEVNGDKGAVRFAFEDMNVLWFFDATLDARTAGWRRIVATSSAGAHPYVANWWPDAHVLGYEHGFVNQAADILRVLSGGEPEAPLPDFADAYETQRVLEAALISARERCAVKLSAVR